MDYASYREAAAQRFTEFGGFTATPEAHLPPLVAEWADLVVEREEPGLYTLVAFLPLQTGSLLPPICDEVITSLSQMVGERRTEAIALLLLVSEEPITRELYDRMQSLTHHGGKVRLVPWLVDLARGRLFGHQGPPFGIDPDLGMLASPAVERQMVPSAERRTRPARMPWLTVSLAVILVGIWLLMTIVGRSLSATEDAELLYRFGAALRPHLIEDQQYWRLFTAGFLHIGAAHLLMNTLSIWWVGQVVEILYGRGRMLFIYLIALVAGSVASLVFGPPIILSAGASGAIFGLLGALLWYRLRGPERHRLRQVPLFVILLINLGYGLLSAETVDNWAHVGGLLGGLIAAMAVGVPNRKGGRTSRVLLHGVAALLLIGLTGSTLAGRIPLPGPSQLLLRSMEALEEGRLTEAAKGLESLAARQPDDVRIQLALGWVYADQGRLSEAKIAADRVLRLDPTSTGARELLQYLEQVRP